MSAVGLPAVPGSGVVDLELPVVAAPTPKTGSKTSMATPKTMKGGGLEGGSLCGASQHPKQSPRPPSLLPAVALQKDKDMAPTRDPVRPVAQWGHLLAAGHLQAKASWSSFG